MCVCGSTYGRKVTNLLTYTQNSSHANHTHRPFEAHNSISLKQLTPQPANSRLTSTPPATPDVDTAPNTRYDCPATRSSATVGQFRKKTDSNYRGTKWLTELRTGWSPQRNTFPSSRRGPRGLTGTTLFRNQTFDRNRIAACYQQAESDRDGSTTVLM